jgi:hypothetical protein
MGKVFSSPLDLKLPGAYIFKRLRWRALYKFEKWVGPSRKIPLSASFEAYLTPLDFDKQPAILRV